jgi:LPXTG-motif cell wall-anchored protein
LVIGKGVLANMTWQALLGIASVFGLVSFLVIRRRRRRIKPL